MNSEILKNEIERLAVLSFSRSSKKGGQNVNKVNTRVQAHLDIGMLSCLAENELDAIQRDLSNRINTDGKLQVSVQNSRSQWQNRTLALEKLHALLLRSALKAKMRPRRKTRPNRSAVEKRLVIKRRIADKKKNRRPDMTI